ncbi:MAG: hypothetical protein HY049_19995 [Acidobacteria bacterium]|nr:hypothetical protein [Acidobacteriota bacterium]
MTADGGLAFDEKVRRSLTPLCGPLRIDAFLGLMSRERAKQMASRAAVSRPVSPGVLTERISAAPAPRAERPRETEPAEAAPDTLADSSKLKAEVDAFLHRDDRSEASSGEVDDYLEFIGHSAFNPEDIPE